MTTNTKKDADRVYPKLRETNAGCWEWQGVLDKAGYGKVSIAGTRVNTFDESFFR